MATPFSFSQLRDGILERLPFPETRANIAEGYAIGSSVQRGMIGVGQRTKGGRTKGSYGQSVLSPKFKEEVNKKGITLGETPAKFLGAYASRVIVDVANDGSRTYWWRYNHPLAIANRLSELGLESAGLPDSISKDAVTKSLISLGIGLPAIATAGTYDVTNPDEQFRPKGYTQSYAPEGADDRRKTQQPAQELFERFFLGRTGRPLKYETAKEDIPDLTPQRYGNYLNYLYNDKGVLGLGIVKGTMENLQGVPEARLLGFPVSVPMVGGFAAGTAGAIIGAKLGTSAADFKKQLLRNHTTAPRRAIIGGALGSALGVAMGNAVNEVVASANRKNLPRLIDYQEDNI